MLSCIRGLGKQVYAVKSGPSSKNRLYDSLLYPPPSRLQVGVKVAKTVGHSTELRAISVMYLSATALPHQPHLHYLHPRPHKAHTHESHSDLIHLHRSPSHKSHCHQIHFHRAHLYSTHSTQESTSNYESQSDIINRFPRNIQPYLKLIRLDRPIGTWVIFWPGAWSIAMATPPGDFPDVKLLGLFLVGSFVMRGSGCTINDLWDKDYDRMVDRTKNRPLASGELSSLQALVFLSGQLSVALAILLCLNTYTIALGASSMVLVISYPLMKRFTYWPQIFLGLTINWGALLGYSAVNGSCDWSVCVPLYGACVAWTMLYDTIYAYQDVEDDCKIGVKSTALLLGKNPHRWLGGCGAAMAGMLMAAGLNSGQEWPYYLGVTACLGHVAWQVSTLKVESRDDCLKKFLSNTHIGIWLFLAIITSNLITPNK